jgi:hypothetical protein
MVAFIRPSSEPTPPTAKNRPMALAPKAKSDELDGQQRLTDLDREADQRAGQGDGPQGAVCEDEGESLGALAAR